MFLDFELILSYQEIKLSLKLFVLDIAWRIILKKILISLTMCLAVFLQLFSSGLRADENRKTADEEMRGVWVASVVNIDYPRTPTTNPLFLKREADLIIEQAYQTGLNAIFLQVRPTSDALYKSDIFPWSKWLTGKEGLAPDEGFDPLQYFIEKSHEKGIEVHAWLNPYRITKRLSGEPVPTTNNLADGHPAKINPQLVIAHEGNLYYDPALPEVRKLIADGAKEIVEKYDIDGIHFDDYFYPGTDFNDVSSYKKYGEGKDKGNWRRENVNKMVEEVRNAIKKANPKVEFGISPFGIWKNKANGDEKSNPYGIQGSLTKGNQSYTAHYADSVFWVKNGLIDYINPQIYWHRGFNIADYNVLSSWWANIVKGTNVKLYIGHAAYRSGSDDADSPWHGPYEILEQVLLNKKIPEIDGSIFFSMKSLQKQPELRERLGIIYGSKKYKTDIKIGIHLPSEDIKTAMNVHYIGGASDPTKPLFINGKKIENRSVNGFFGTTVELKYGKNEIIMVNGDNRFVRNIYREESSGAGGNKLSSAEIVQETCYPKKQAIIRDTGSITLECTAPSGASVFAEVSGYKIPLERVWGGSSYSLYPAKYRATFKPIQFFDHVEIYDYGNVTYHMYYDGKTDSKISSGSLQYVSQKTKIFAKVIKDEIDLRITKNPSDGSAEILEKGAIEEVRESDGDMVLLASGRYTEAENLTMIYSVGNSSHHVGFDSYSVGEKEDVVALKLEDNYVIIPKLNKGSIDVQMAAVGTMDNINIPTNAMVSKTFSSIKNGRGFYSFLLKNPNQYNGSYVSYDNGKAFIHLRKRPRISSGEKPLSGINIMLDAGHGESDSGAIGLMGNMYPEKAYALDAVKTLKKQLEDLGAKITLTRDSDKDVSLQERLRMSYRQKPDMFISIHANSIGLHRNIAYIEGFSVYYSKNLALPFANILQNEIVEKIGRNDRNKLTDDFYVIRGTWTPSVLIETGFMPNPNDFDWLYDKDRQELFIKEIVGSILIYFNDGRK